MEMHRLNKKNVFWYHHRGFIFCEEDSCLKRGICQRHSHRDFNHPQNCASYHRMFTEACSVIGLSALCELRGDR